MRVPRFPLVSAALTTAAGLAVLAGWGLGSSVLIGLAPGLATMKANTALCFVLLGVALGVLSTGRGRAGRSAVVALSLTAAVLAAATVSQDLAGWSLGIDQIIVLDRTSEPMASPGRMSPITAACFVLLGCALALEARGRRLGTAVGRAFMVAVALMAYLALIGYAYDVAALYSLRPYKSVALHTVAALLLTSTGALWLRPRAGLLAVVTTDLPAGFAVRRLLAAAFVIPPLLGSLLLNVLHHWEASPELLFALFVAGCASVFSGLIWWSGRELVASQERRTRFEEALARSEERFAKMFHASPAAISLSTLTEGRSST
jgi:hypothetical protein